MSDGTVALQTAIYSALSADAGIRALVGNPARIYDHVAASPTFPYIVIGDTGSAPSDTKDFNGFAHTVDVHVWSRPRDAAGSLGSKEARQILSAIYAVLQNGSLSLSSGNHVETRFVSSDVYRDPDGRTRHGVSRFRVRTDFSS